MMITCLLGFPIFTWLRLRSTTILPAVLAHSFVRSTSVQLVRVFASADATIDPLETSLFGWPGWVVMAGFVVWLIHTDRLVAPVTQGTSPASRRTVTRSVPVRDEDRR